MRRFIHAASLRPVSGERRLGLIRDLSLLSLEAEQAFLKTLEEPISSMLFLIFTPHLAILPTTLSRVRLIATEPISVDHPDAADWLTKLSTPPLSQGFLAAKELAELPDYATLLLGMISRLRQSASHAPSYEQQLTALWRAWQTSQTNASKRLQAEALVIHLQAVDQSV